MSNDTREYRTGQGVPQTGVYICQSGERVEINKDDVFPACPVKGKKTTWKHEAI
ncbi:hypothetical protein [Terribacillus saccharophilus]|uniref:hypothetical protein n=1 Tax=Terribacillus saccharophilus TaxID=361277 RepID=UPI00148287E5|nr:hypothetical protein [Terribacillus saccharophilus]